MLRGTGLLSPEKQVCSECSTLARVDVYSSVHCRDSLFVWEFQNRANHVSANLDDLKKTLYERGRALGVKPKSAVPIEVSTGTFGA